MRQNNRMTAIKHEQEQETTIENITFHSVIEMIEKDQKKIEFLLSDLTLQKSSLERTIAANEEIAKNTELLKPDDDIVAVENLISKWVEVVDLVDSKTGMLDNAIKVRDSENDEFRFNIRKRFELGPVQNTDFNIEMNVAFSSLPIEELYNSICSQKNVSIEFWHEYQNWIYHIANLLISSTKSLIFEHFSEKGKDILR